MRFLYEQKKELIQISEGENMNFPAHLHDAVELLYVLSGTIDTICEGQERLLVQNEAVISFPNTIHSYETIEESRYIICIFPPQALPLFKSQFPKIPVTPFLSAEDASLVFPYLYSLLAEAGGDRNPDLVTSLLSVILSLLLKKLPLTSRSAPAYDDLLPGLLLYLEEHYLEDCTLSGTADAFALNASYLSRFFVKRTQCTFTRYVHELRISYARYLLQYTDKPVTEIAYECGFSTQRSFNRVFIQIVRCSPREYRNTL